MPGGRSVYHIKFDFRYCSSLMGAHFFAVASGTVFFWILGFVCVIAILPIVFNLSFPQLPGWCYTVSVVFPILLLVLVICLIERSCSRSRHKAATPRIQRLRSLVDQSDHVHRFPHRVIELALYEHQRRRSPAPDGTAKRVKEALVGISGNPVILINSPTRDWKVISPPSDVAFEPILLGHLGEILELEPDLKLFIEEELNSEVDEAAVEGDRRNESLVAGIGRRIWMLSIWAIFLLLLVVLAWIVFSAVTANPIIFCGLILSVIFVVFAYTVIVGKRTFLVPGGVFICSQPVWRRKPVIRYIRQDESPLLINFSEDSSYVVHKGKAVEISGTNDLLWAWMNTSRKPTLAEIKAFLGDQTR